MIIMLYKVKLHFIYTVMLFFASHGGVLCEEWEGICVGVADGDTISVMNGGKGIKLRVYGVDCPEGGQPFGKRAKAFTSDKVYGKQVTVATKAMDRYGRTVAMVYVAGESLGQSLIENGLAWVYAAYCAEPERTQWSSLEEAARTARLGLWEQPDAIPPWQWRKEKRQGKSIASPTALRSPIRNVHYIESIGPSRELYYGNVRSRVFHRETCGGLKGCTNCAQEFTSRSQAIEARYNPCGWCNP